MLGDLWVDDLAAMRLEPLVRAFFVRSHQTRVARHIGGEDRSETADSRHCPPEAITFWNKVYPEIVLEPIYGSRPESLRFGSRSDRRCHGAVKDRFGVELSAPVHRAE
jgi:hypothetical protein